METPRRPDFWLKLSGLLSIIRGKKKRKKCQPTFFVLLITFVFFLNESKFNLHFPGYFFFLIKVVEVSFNTVQLNMCLYNNSPLLSFALPL